MHYVFGECTLDTAQYVLYRAGRSILLQPKVFQVLQYLLTQRDRVISKQELREQVWPEQFISDATVEGVIKAVRLVVGDDGRTQWCIQTRRGQGYRFVAPLLDPAAVPKHTAMLAESPDLVALPVPPEVPVTSTHDTLDVCRRQLTVLCCDLVDWAVLSTQLDPEDLREVVLAYHEACSEVIERYNGSIAQYLENGLLVYFGYPHAHEDDAQRAVRAGLDILEAIKALNIRLENDLTIRLAVRVGLHTGTVVMSEVDDSTRHQSLALGATPTIAAGIQGIAAPHTVVMSAATYQLVMGFFVSKNLGEQILQGVAEPLGLYRVLSASGIQSRFELAYARGLTPLVGRASEVALLQERWEQVKDGLGHVVLLTGEPGIGKSRLAQELKEHVVRQGGRSMEFRCSPYHSNSAFYPVIGYMQRLLEFCRDETPQEKLDKLERMLSTCHFPLADAVPLFAALLSLPPPDQYPPLAMSSERQKQKTLEALVAWLLVEAERQPVLVLYEDLHWADPSTLELLSHLIDQAPLTLLLCLMTFRPPFQPPWPMRSHLTQVTLNRLSRVHVQQMVQLMGGGKPLAADVVQHVVDKTDGIPLFVEELVAMMRESGLLREVCGRYALAGAVPALAIPATLQDALMARLDRLETGREVACLGATLGRAFSYELIRAVSPLDEAALQHGLRQLVESELLYQHGFPPQARYVFKHALIRDTAYQSLLRRSQQQYHQRIAQVLTEHCPEMVETQPELVAQHYTEAGLHEQAIVYWQQASQKAMAHSAHVEAIQHLTTGLEFLKTLPDTPERTQRELLLQLALSRALMATKGYAAPEVGDVCTRAQALCLQMGETPQLFPVLFGLWQFAIIRAEFQTAGQLGERLLSLAQKQEEPTLGVDAHRALGYTRLSQGELLPAREHLEQGLVLCDLQHRHCRDFLSGQDSGVTCLVYVGQTLWMLGYADQALHRNREALAWAKQLAHPYSLALALGWAVWLHQHRREIRLTQEYTEALLALTMEHGFALWQAQGTIMQGWALAMQGQGEAGIARIRQGLDAIEGTGTQLMRPYFLALLAEVYGHVGRIEQGRTVLARARTLAQTRGERFYEAELYRLEGVLLLSLPGEHDAEAETALLQACAIARHQQAKSWELRAATSLGRLWQQQGKIAEARQLLAKVYGWFTEGFATPDLQEAKALLEELSP